MYLILKFSQLKDMDLVLSPLWRREKWGMETWLFASQLGRGAGGLDVWLCIWPRFWLVPKASLQILISLPLLYEAVTLVKSLFLHLSNGLADGFRTCSEGDAVWLDTGDIIDEPMGGRQCCEYQSSLIVGTVLSLPLQNTRRIWPSGLSQCLKKAMGKTSWV